MALNEVSQARLLTVANNFRSKLFTKEMKQRYDISVRNGFFEAILN